MAALIRHVLSNIYRQSQKYKALLPLESPSKAPQLPPDSVKFGMRGRTSSVFSTDLADMARYGKVFPTTQGDYDEILSYFMAQNEISLRSLTEN